MTEIYKTYRGDEPIYFGPPAELADKLSELPWYGVWTDQQGHWALCRAWPCPSWKEVTHASFGPLPNPPLRSASPRAGLA